MAETLSGIENDLERQKHRHRHRHRHRHSRNGRHIEGHRD